MHWFCLFFFFFFFKRKTAYEVRSRDGRSDVCSSDLPAARLVGPAGALGARHARTDSGRPAHAIVDAQALQRQGPGTGLQIDLDDPFDAGLREMMRGDADAEAIGLARRLHPARRGSLADAHGPADLSIGRSVAVDQPRPTATLALAGG